MFLMRVLRNNVFNIICMITCRDIENYFPTVSKSSGENSASFINVASLRIESNQHAFTNDRSSACITHNLFNGCICVSHRIGLRIGIHALFLDFRWTWLITVLFLESWPILNMLLLWTTSISEEASILEVCFRLQISAPIDLKGLACHKLCLTFT